MHPSDHHLYLIIIGALLILLGFSTRELPPQGEYDIPSFDWRKEHCIMKESAKQ